MTADDRMDYSEEVRAALAEGKPLVALESTIMTHGMPFPQNLETALSVESIIREESVVPATIAILKGRIKIGLEHEELKELAEASEAFSLK